MNLEYLIVDLNLIEFSTLFAQQSLPVAVYPCLSVCVCVSVWLYGVIIVGGSF